MVQPSQLRFGRTNCGPNNLSVSPRARSPSPLWRCRPRRLALLRPFPAITGAAAPWRCSAPLSSLGSLPPCFPLALACTRTRNPNPSRRCCSFFRPPSARSPPPDPFAATTARRHRLWLFQLPLELWLSSPTSSSSARARRLDLHVDPSAARLRLYRLDLQLLYHDAGAGGTVPWCNPGSTVWWCGAVVLWMLLRLLHF